jgi:hypothetical protein
VVFNPIYGFGIINVRHHYHMGLIDDSKASEYLGKTVLIGMTYLDRDGQLRERKQMAGTITVFSQAEGIKIKLRDVDRQFCLPPDEGGIRVAPPGTYRLRSTGEEIINPDYLSTWTVNEHDPDGMPNQSPDPTLSSGTPPAGQESRLS